VEVHARASNSQREADDCLAASAEVKAF